jgi:hypothetical protein
MQSSVNASPARVVPICRKKGLNNFDQMLGIAQEYNLGYKVCSQFAERGRLISAGLKDLIKKHATDEYGAWSRGWKDMTTIERFSLVEAIHKVEPWLLRHFEAGWATDWLLKKIIDTRVADRNRKQRPRPRCKLVIY